MTGAAEVRDFPKIVLLATDLSARCDRALDRAAELAGDWNARLLAVHALEADFDAFRDGDQPSWRSVSSPAQRAEQILRHDLAGAAGAVSVIVERNDPTELVLRVAEERGAGLIVTGLARNEALGRFWLGTTVDSLLARTSVPVLVVKERPRAAYGRVLVAIDFSETSLRALQAAAQLFPDRPLTLLHAFDPPLAGMISEPARYREEYRKVALADCIAFLARAGLPGEQSSRFEIIVEHGDLETLVWQYVRDRRVDLVVVGKSNPGPLLGFFVGSNSQRILASLDCDVLVVPNRQAQ